MDYVLFGSQAINRLYGIILSKVVNKYQGTANANKYMRVDSEGNIGLADTTVTSENISTALGFTPADSANVPEVPSWALQSEKPAYTYSEVGASAASHTHTLSEITNLISLLDEKMDKQAQYSYSSQTVSLALKAEDACYKLTGTTNLTITFPSGDFNALIDVKFSSDTSVNVSFPTSTEYIGTAMSPSSNDHWQISIRNGIVVCGKAQ